VHSENVSDHTKKVVTNLIQNGYFSALSNEDKDIAKLSAYLHDIGKGPKSKWNDGKQKAYADHPADAIPMLERILVEEFEELSEYEIRKICMLVVYHDLIGDIIGNNRSQKELIDLIEDENELNMLIAISLADVSAINFVWTISLNSELPNLIHEAKEALK
jgi:HD superfamily phosphodiesterase